MIALGRVNRVAVPEARVHFQSVRHLRCLKGCAVVHFSRLWRSRENLRRPVQDLDVGADVTGEV